ncbi:hypothetical protein H0H81_002319 [Sphagnurus paluster]|uniref:F-box domain-containing protein n=1 Tax=Sphagnurus paluster TaxID=117069 RepID=A0A9P7GLX7_9AGAR|nr:hypothetical protein H0H81_002319 [Sphagnurus paluster]
MENIAWTALSIISLASLFVLSMSWLGEGPRPPPHVIPPRQYLAEVRQRQAEKSALLEKERSRTRILTSWMENGFHFQTLPVEIQMTVLAFCADTPATYRALVCVSRSVYVMTLRACLPLMPITLSSPRQLISFSHLVCRDETPIASSLDAGVLVHRLWLSPLRREDTSLAYRILRACSNVRALACDARTLSAAIARCTRFKHEMCRELTLLLSRPQWECAMDTPSGLQFLQQLTHLRLMGEPTVPRTLPLPALTQMSYPDQLLRPEGENIVRPWALGTPVAFPSLQQVVLTRRCGPAGHIPEEVDPRLLVVYVPRDQTEMEVWCAAAKGQSLWYHASLALPVARQPM